MSDLRLTFDAAVNSLPHVPRCVCCSGGAYGVKDVWLAGDGRRKPLGKKGGGGGCGAFPAGAELEGCLIGLAILLVILLIVGCFMAIKLLLFKPDPPETPPPNPEPSNPDDPVFALRLPFCRRHWIRFPRELRAEPDGAGGILLSGVSEDFAADFAMGKRTAPEL